MTREQLVDVLEEMAMLLELKGESSFRIRAYRQGAEAVQKYPEDIVALACENRLEGIKGIGAALREKLHLFAKSNTFPALEALRAEFPESLFELFEIQGLGPRKIKQLYEAGISSLGALRRACEDETLSNLAGFGKKTVQNILAGIEHRERNAGRFLLMEASTWATLLREHLLLHPQAHQVEIAGSLRRGKESVHDIDLLVASSEPEEIMAHFLAFPERASTLAAGSTKASIVLQNGLQCDLRVVTTAQLPFALQYFTGSKEHNTVLRTRARQKGYTLNEYELTQLEDQPSQSIDTEAALYQALELPWIAPELRENNGEIEAAEQGHLPNLLELENLRGTFHCHTTASDGRSTLEEMAQAAQDLGLQYLGISDHSKASVQASGLNETRLLAQIEAIDKLNQSLDGLHLFTGSEVDILRDGSLDFSDEILAKLDFVVASVHQSYNLSEEEQTQRMLKAIENPHVTMLGHPTGRLLLRREAYSVNVKKLIEAAAETNTIIELNCSSKRLDLDWRWWKFAKEQGVMCSINPDAHHTEHFQTLPFGVKVARKGWLEPKNALNTRILQEVKTFLQTPKENRQALTT